VADESRRELVIPDLRSRKIRESIAARGGAYTHQDERHHVSHVGAANTHHALRERGGAPSANHSSACRSVRDSLFSCRPSRGACRFQVGPDRTQGKLEDVGRYDVGFYFARLDGEALPCVRIARRRRFFRPPRPDYTPTDRRTSVRQHRSGGSAEKTPRCALLG